MAFFMPNTPRQLGYPVLASCVINIVAAGVLFQAGSLFGAAISLAMGVGTYMFVYRMLATDPREGKTGVALMAAFEALFVVASYTSHQHGIVFALEIAAIVCLGFAYTRFRDATPA